MRGKKHNKQTIYNIMSLMFTTNNCAETSRKLNLPESTVNTIYLKYKDNPEFVELRAKKNKSFSDRADETINKVWELLDRKIERCKNQYDEIQNAIDNLSNMDSNDISQQDIKDSIKNLKELQEMKASELTNIFGVMYDKKRLNEDKSTQNVSFNYEELITKIEGDEY